MGGGHRIGLDELHEALAVLVAILHRGLLDQHAHFLLGHFHTVSLADFRQQQAQTHAALGDRLVFVLLVLDLLERSGRIRIAHGFLLELRPDLLELGIDHGRGDFEAVARSKLIEQRALHLGAGHAGGLLLELRLHDLLELLKAVETEALGEILVDLGFGFDLQRLHDDIESRFFAGEVIGLVIFREGDGDGLFLARLHADQLLFEARYKGARTQHKGCIRCLAAVELDTIELADEIDDQLIAVSRLLGLGGVLVALVLARNAGQRLVDLGVGHRHRQTFKL